MAISTLVKNVRHPLAGCGTGLAHMKEIPLPLKRETAGNSFFLTLPPKSHQNFAWDGGLEAKTVPGTSLAISEVGFSQDRSLEYSLVLFI